MDPAYCAFPDRHHGNNSPLCSLVSVPEMVSISVRVTEVFTQITHRPKSSRNTAERSCESSGRGVPADGGLRASLPSRGCRPPTVGQALLEQMSQYAPFQSQNGTLL